MEGLGREKRWREVVKTTPHPLLSCFVSNLSFFYTNLTAKSRERSKEANLKGIPEILFPRLPLTPLQIWKC